MMFFAFFSSNRFLTVHVLAPGMAPDSGGVAPLSTKDVEAVSKYRLWLFGELLR